MEEKELKDRTKRFALRVIRLVSALPRSQLSRVLGGQLLRAGTSVGANYRAACRARSMADFISKLGIVVEEVDETSYWMELMVESKLVKENRMREIMREAGELTAIFTSSILTAKNHHSKI